MTIRTLIVDDEPLARRGVALLLLSQPDFFVAGECRNGQEAVAVIAATKPDLIFLDIQMPGMSGFEVLSSIDSDAVPATIFLTAYDEFALAAFDVQALDYLLKPIDEERFLAALVRAREMITLRKLSALQDRIAGLLAIEAELNKAGPAKRLVVRERGRAFFVPVEDVEWIEAVGDYAGLHVGNRTHLLRESMTALASRLDPTKFVRIHRSAIVQIDCVAAMRARTNRDGTVQLKSGMELKVSRLYSSEFRTALAKHAPTDKAGTTGTALPYRRSL
jgi:two-component system LytT family response regulator